jgi:hypothetical protein
METFTITKYNFKQWEIEEIVRNHRPFRGKDITFNWDTDDEDIFLTVTTEEVNLEDK